MNHRSCATPLQFLASVLVCGVVAAACSSRPKSAFEDAPAPGTDSNRDAGTFTGAGVPGDPPNGTFGDDAGGPTSVDAACASQSSTAEKQPLDIYIMLDQSGSMNEDVASGTKWTAVTSALTTFVNQPALAGVSVGIQYFGARASGQCPPSCQTDSDCGPNGPCVHGTCFRCQSNVFVDSCDAADYAQPEVEIAPLPGVAPAIIQSISKHSPITGTPTAPALQGAVDHAKAWAQAHPDHVTIALFATDGEPSECDTDLPNINAIAATAAAGTPKILTFVIGVGTSLTALNGIAMAGGTDAAFVVDTAGNVNQQFLDALNKIRIVALGCQYQIPLPKGGGSLDYGSVNVQYTPGGGAPVIVPKVADESQCPAIGDAWYYDDNMAPTQILLCDGSCDNVKVDLTSAVSILVGCTTVVK